MGEVVAALDIGGTKLAAALVRRSGELVDRRTAPTPAKAGGRAILAVASELVAALHAGSPAELVALGIGSAGVVDPVSGRVLAATDQLADWAGTDLTELGAPWRLPVAAMNDVHAHALGEASAGDTMLFLAVGTGIGGAYVVDGAVLAGAHSVAGHAGHVPSVYADRTPCTCGGRGHLEAIASGPALVAKYEQLSGEQAGDLRAVAERAAAGDQVAAEVIEYGGTAVGSALGGLVNMLDPHEVVIGGGVAGLGVLWWNALRAEFRREALPRLADVPVSAARLGNDAALIGAAKAAWERTG
ncbi:ROK family protein [Kribbella sp. NPDC048928]|uniref:ROK family protein n=1 Tax=Kribbella sp. NPDC048928 TaxID=3364111 RepID=UPI003722540A